MKIMKRIREWRSWTPPPLTPEVASFPLYRAYVCLSCRIVQDTAPHGTCIRCQDDVYPITLSTGVRADRSPRIPTVHEMNDNLALNLTMREKE
jgi:hypothetical protein